MNIAKLLWSILGTGLFFLQTSLSDNDFSPFEQVSLGSLVLGTIATWLVPNTPALTTAKTWVNAASVGTALLATLLGGGLTGQEWMSVLILVLTTAGVYTIPNKSNVTRNSFA
jgi:hypothetical protein